MSDVQCRRLEGMAAIVTGASRGIGLGIATRLIGEGASVCITGRNEEALRAAAGAMPDDVVVAVAGKAAISHLTRTLALELAPDVRVNAVAPAVVKTQFARALYAAWVTGQTLTLDGGLLSAGRTA